MEVEELAIAPIYGGELAWGMLRHGATNYIAAKIWYRLNSLIKLLSVKALVSGLINRLVN